MVTVTRPTIVKTARFLSIARLRMRFPFDLRVSRSLYHAGNVVSVHSQALDTL
jgi:hypothetical protein